MSCLLRGFCQRFLDTKITLFRGMRASSHWKRFEVFFFIVRSRGFFHFWEPFIIYGSGHVQLILAPMSFRCSSPFQFKVFIIIKCVIFDMKDFFSASGHKVWIATHKNYHNIPLPKCGWHIQTTFSLSWHMPSATFCFTTKEPQNWTLGWSLFTKKNFNSIFFTFLAF